MTTTALILAAGKGTRMRSSLAKVLHPLCGRPMAGWVLTACSDAGLTPTLVVGHQADRVRDTFPGVPTALQAEQNGTGHAVACAAEVLPRQGTLVVLAGDTPLVRGATLTALVEAHTRTGALCTVLTMKVDEPGAYGRIVRGATGVERIVEAANASVEELAIDEVNSGMYAFDAAWLLDEVIPHLVPHPPKNELYLTDAIEAAAAAGRLDAACHDDADELMGVNDKAALAVATKVLRDRINLGWMEAGVTMHDPAQTYIDATVSLEQDVTLEPGVVLKGSTTIATGTQVFAHSVLEDATVGPDCKVGPFARLRPGTVLTSRVKVGNFVETKKAVLHDKVSAGHLSYLGDTEIGAGSNIGAGTITCNYDGFGKHRTEIGERAFIGSNSSLVAPVVIGADTIVAAGSTITNNVADDALALARARQKNLAGKAQDIHRRNKERAEQ
ncbi:MAG: UDP-N-acetylglucosamine diphosphorylase/glucosamine-1-phosphate N-acetyltransferase [Proteobacteria bacterium]|nr:UDP-N-acetylglucosamine diphosphorylase/glucosamine-1-phosphate N-acetyltransferase [Pseudomonadota bacterium]